jgi:predicted transposase YbfD/YdcC
VTDDKEAIAIDGKTLRGSHKQGAPASHLLSALSHRLGLTLAQAAVDDKTNEIAIIPEVLADLVLRGRVVTLDAMHTQKETAKTIIGCQADYIMLVKGNQPSLLEDIQLICQHKEAFADRFSLSETIDLGHGRLEHRCLISNSELSGYTDWPGLQQVFELQRHVTFPKSGHQFEETVYGVTSLKADQASPSRLLEYIRQHWHIENQSHWVRDVTFDEDRSQVRCGSIPQVMAALRNTVIGLMRYCGESNIAAACRRLAAQPCEALKMIGIDISA